MSRTPLDEMFALSDAVTIDEFHGLVLFPAVDQNRADAFEPVCLFRHHPQLRASGVAQRPAPCCSSPIPGGGTPPVAS